YLTNISVHDNYHYKGNHWMLDEAKKPIVLKDVVQQEDLLKSQNNDISNDDFYVSNSGYIYSLVSDYSKYEENKICTQLTKKDSKFGIINKINIDSNIEWFYPVDDDRMLTCVNDFLFTISLNDGATGNLFKISSYFGAEIAVSDIARVIWISDPGANTIRSLKYDSLGVITERFRIYPQLSGPPIYVTPDGFYSCIEAGGVGLHFSDNRKTYPLEQFDLQMNRPDIVMERIGVADEAVAIARQMREKRLKRMGVTEDMLKPDFHVPEIEILGDIPVSTADRDIEISIKAQDTKYPLERLKIFVNNVPINGRDGESLREAKIQSLERSIPIKLGSGRNKVQVSVLNSAGAESLYANAELTCTAARAKPRLFAVAMGVSEYANPEWNLKYAAKDAKDLIECIRSRSASNYGVVKELLLTDSAVTKESMVKIREFLSEATIDDTVILFVAGHGLLDNKYDYYFGTSDIDFKNPSARGIAYEEFDDLLASLPSLKKSLLIDTCHAGELDEEEKQMLASTQQSSNQVVAMLPSGARGMTVSPVEGARGKSEWYDRLQGLFVDLRRGSGSTILSSSAGAEYALESSDQRNGLFTYAVIEAMEGKGDADANKDGLIQMTEITQYVKKRVSDLSNNKQTPNIRRVNLEGDFAATMIK
ncbi:MAG: caspase family protein, partial [Proteobacteria bacterium]|nr:caspase family protein [Pseudomonadota bacterium]